MLFYFFYLNSLGINIEKNFKTFFIKGCDKLYTEFEFLIFYFYPKAYSNLYLLKLFIILRETFINS